MEKTYEVSSSKIYKITDKIRDNTKNSNGFRQNISNWIDCDLVYPTNVLHFATACNNKKHKCGVS